MVRAMGFDRLAASVGSTLYRARGCERCSGTGYSGRTSVAELLPMSEAVRDLTLRHADTLEIEKIALDEGMDQIRQVCLKKVLDGITTLEEVLRVNQESLSWPDFSTRRLRPAARSPRA